VHLAEVAQRPSRKAVIGRARKMCNGQLDDVAGWTDEPAVGGPFDEEGL
jgi:hypothetical protein